MDKLYVSVLVFGWEVNDKKVFKYLNDNNLEMGCEVKFGGTVATLEWFGNHWANCMRCFMCLTIESSIYGAQYRSIDLKEFNALNNEVSDEIIQFAFDVLESTEETPTIHLTMDIHN